MTRIEQSSIETSDGTRLNLLEAGSGAPLVMLPGWSQTAAMFRHQLDGLSGRYRVIAMDHRGHGDSENVAHGYRLSRLARDLHDVLDTLELEDVAVLGHSMGCAVLWCHWDLFGRDRFSKMVLVDQPAALMARPAWSDGLRRDRGSIVTPEEIAQNCDAVEGDDAAAFAAEFVGGMLGAGISADDRRFIVEQNLRMPRHAAASLLQSCMTSDWSDLIPRIDVPTLIVGGRASTVPFSAQEWTHRQIRGSVLVAFEAEEGGSHFMFWEGWERFNRTVAEFLG